MAFPVTTIGFKPLPVQSGDEWRVEATFPDGHVEQVTGFQGEEEARDWIGSAQCLQWAKTKGYE